MSATFARFHPNLILGGTYSGQVVLWDNRVQKRTPVQRSPLSAAAHTHPVLLCPLLCLFLGSGFFSPVCRFAIVTYPGIQQCDPSPTKVTNCLNG